MGAYEASGPAATDEVMVRTQIYLTRAEHGYLQREADRQGKPMAAVIRSLIDARMTVPADAWANNPMLEATPVDPEWTGHADGAINHDHYIYGSPKRFVEAKGRWVAAEPLPEDYYERPAGAARRARAPKRQPPKG